jgi:hypothetical protein
MASSLTEATVGMIITPITNPALSALKICKLGKSAPCKNGVTNVRAK